MTTILFIFCVIYALGFLWCFTNCLMVIDEGKTNELDRVIGTLVALVISIPWPFVLPIQLRGRFNGN